MSTKRKDKRPLRNLDVLMARAAAEVKPGGNIAHVEHDSWCPTLKSIGLPDEGKPYLHLPVAHLLDGDPGIHRAMRARETVELRDMAAHIAHCAKLLPHFLEALGLPPQDGSGFWVDEVLLAIRKELRRRQLPMALPRRGGPLARLKQVDLVTLAERYTSLQPAGLGKLRGLCPLHQEKTASFYVYEDSRRWHCFGACATGGDVIDLLERLSTHGALS